MTSLQLQATIERPVDQDPPPGELMMRMITGYWVTQIVHGAARTALAERLHHGPMTAGQFAEAARINPDAAFRFLRACCSLGLVVATDPAGAAASSFSTTPLLDTLRHDNPQSLRGLALSQPAPGHWQTWGRFSEALRTGECQAVPALGSEIFDYFAKHQQESDAFTEAMSGLTAAVSQEVSRVLDTGAFMHAVDVGGAAGALLVSLMEVNPLLMGTVFDMPSVIPNAQRSAVEAGLQDRMCAVGGDFFKEVPSGDLLLLKYILHDWNDEACLRILRNCRTALRRSGQIAIIELVVDELGEPGLAPLMDLNMMVMLHGRERTFREYQALLEEAGFLDAELLRTNTPMAIITARPA